MNRQLFHCADLLTHSSNGVSSRRWHERVGQVKRKCFQNKEKNLPAVKDVYCVRRGIFDVSTWSLYLPTRFFMVLCRCVLGLSVRCLADVSSQHTLRCAASNHVTLSFKLSTNFSGCRSTSEMTYIVSGGALNSTHLLRLPPARSGMHCLIMSSPFTRTELPTSGENLCSTAIFLLLAFYLVHLKTLNFKMFWLIDCSSRALCEQRSKQSTTIWRTLSTAADRRQTRPLRLWLQSAPRDSLSDAAATSPRAQRKSDVSLVHQSVGFSASPLSELTRIKEYLTCGS